MFYERELRFMSDVFEKAHLGIKKIARADIEKELCEYSIGGLIDPRFSPGGSIPELFERAEKRTVYKLVDCFYRCFVFILLDTPEASSILSIGPYLSAEITEGELLLLTEEMKIPIQKKNILREYYMSLPILQPDGHIMIMLNTFFEWLWKTPSFAIVDIGRESIFSEPITESITDSDVEKDALVNIETLEIRYAYENEMLRSVTLGKLHMEDQLISALSPDMFEKRAANPLRNAKNYAIIMNTLLRKAAESGGVHPFYLDKLSSEFAHRIENLNVLAECGELMREMFHRYCRLVRKHNTKGLSQIVKRAVLMIDADLSCDLSTGKIASTLGVSAPYLSSLFKKEIGQTLTGFVLDKRMKAAASLIARTELQIQTVALNCGIVDVQYFSKLFKKKYGIAPSEYRQKSRQTN